MRHGGLFLSTHAAAAEVDSGQMLSILITILGENGLFLNPSRSIIESLLACLPPLPAVTACALGKLLKVLECVSGKSAKRSSSQLCNMNAVCQWQKLFYHYQTSALNGWKMDLLLHLMHSAVIGECRSDVKRLNSNARAARNHNYAR
jgi:hypothetical protein